MAKIAQPYHGTYHREKSGTIARKCLCRSRIMQYGSPSKTVSKTVS
jgi:hypothetical protein